MTTIDVENLELKAGVHKRPEDGMCLLELAAYLSPRSDFTDHPECVSPVLSHFGRLWNDSLDDATRQMLKPYAAKLLNTATGKRDDETRAWMLTDWLARECAPAFLRCAGLTEQAELLESLAPLTNAATAQEAQSTLDQARKEAVAAWAAAWAAAGDAAWAAAGDAAGDAAWDAARAAAWDAARDAAGVAAGAAAGDAAGAAARDAAWDAAGDAARDAAGAAAWAAAWDAAGAAAGDAAWAAAGAAAWAAAADAAGAAAWAAAWAARAAAEAALAPTVKILQASALVLLDRMIEVGKAAKT